VLVELMVRLPLQVGFRVALDIKLLVEFRVERDGIILLLFGHHALRFLVTVLLALLWCVLLLVLAIALLFIALLKVALIIVPVLAAPITTVLVARELVLLLIDDRLLPGFHLLFHLCLGLLEEASGCLG